MVERAFGTGAEAVLTQFSLFLGETGWRVYIYVETAP